MENVPPSVTVEEAAANSTVASGCAHAGRVVHASRSTDNSRRKRAARGRLPGKSNGDKEGVVMAVNVLGVRRARLSVT